MARRIGLALAVLLAGGSGCKHGAGPTGALVDAGATANPASIDASSSAPSEGQLAIFSAPIAGARVAGGSVIAAGLVVATHSITAARVDASGRAAWTRPIISDVGWSADAELHAWPIAAGAVIAWRGPLAGKSGHVALIVAPDGRIIDGPIQIGSLVCATDNGVAWSEGAHGGPLHVRLRSWSDGPVTPHDDVGPAITEDFTLTCGARAAYAVAEGDEGAPTRIYSIGPASSGPSPTVLAPNALGRDEERDLFPWAEGDELGLVRIATGGSAQAADIRAGEGALLHADKVRVAPEDDVVAVDADARQVVLVTTHDESDSCPDGRGGASVHALRIPRAGGAATSLAVAPSACKRDVGPFWTNLLGRSLVIAWTERVSRPEKSAAPIMGLAFHTLEDSATTVRLPQAADAIADVGCDGARCYALALVRAPGEDGMKPESVKILAYP